MNCNQARLLLASYREFGQNKAGSMELDAHLEECASCRNILAQYSVIGERVRMVPSIESAPDAHTKLMHALAAEHARFLQHASNAQASSASSVPDFLKPYMNEHGDERHTAQLRAFSSAETGPLPVLPAKRKKRVAPTGQFAVLGLAASFLMIFLVGGLVSLLVLANHGVNNNSNTVISIKNPSLIAPISYTAETAYSHIASAVATPGHVFYSAYNDDETQWMIEGLSGTTQHSGTTKNAVSVPLLQNNSQNPLFVLGASSQWVIWLQFDTPQNKVQHHTSSTAFTRTWSLNALSLPSNGDGQFRNVMTLQRGTFDTTTAPDWVRTPIQGISFIQQDTLLVASLDVKGTAQLVRYQLDTHGGTSSTLIATATNGHVLTSPSATEDGSRTFWSEEWFTDNQQPHSTVWTQEQTQQLVHQRGAWRQSVQVDKHVYGSGDTSFHPLVINDTLFLLSTSDATAPTQGTPNAASSPTVQATATSVPLTPVIARFTTVYPTQIDEFIHGTILAVPLYDVTAQSTTLSSDSMAAAPQAGMRFLLWQSGAGYQMYDAVAKSTVEVKDSTKGASFLEVNGDSAVWVVDAATRTATKNTTSVQTATFNMFNWPSQ